MYPALQTLYIKYIIIDDAQMVDLPPTFPWFKVLKNTIKRHNGFIWSFYGDHRCKTYRESSFPKKPKNYIPLTDVVRNSINVSKFVKREINSPLYKESRTPHTFIGDETTKHIFQKGGVEETVLSEIQKFLFGATNYHPGNIAVIFNGKDLIPESLNCGQEERKLKRIVHTDVLSHRTVSESSDNVWSSEESVDDDEEFASREHSDKYAQGYDFELDESKCFREIMLGNGKIVKIGNGALNKDPDCVVIETIERYSSLDRLAVIIVTRDVDGEEQYVAITRAISTIVRIHVK